jgi:SAM-dependent methyltransferase
MPQEQPDVFNGPPATGRGEPGLLWDDNLGEEAAFWRSWFAEAKFADAREARRSAIASAVFPRRFVRSLGVKPGETFRVLDVASGPLSDVPTKAQENPVERVCVDALADVYNSLLDQYGYDDVPRVLKIKAEELSAGLMQDRFHFVHIANALDHCKDPARALAEMYRVCRPGGLIRVVSIENEGVRQQYQGLHQWNLEADAESLWLWRSSDRRDLLATLDDHTYTWSDLDYGEPGVVKLFRADIRKP